MSTANLVPACLLVPIATNSSRSPDFGFLVSSVRSRRCSRGLPALPRTASLFPSRHPVGKVQ